MMRVRGMRDITTSQQLHTRHGADTRAQRLSELARLEREKERREREAEMWAGHHQRTRLALEQIKFQQQRLYQSLLGSTEPGSAAPVDEAPNQSIPLKVAGEAEWDAEPTLDKEQGERFRAVPLEY